MVKKLKKLYSIKTKRKIISKYHLHSSSGTTYKSYAKYLEQIEKSSKTGQDKKSLMSTFACFLTATAKL